MAIELQYVSTRRVIFVGREAAIAGWPLVQNRAVFKHRIPFPSQWISNTQFKGYVDTLAQEIWQGNGASIAVGLPTSAAKTGTTRSNAPASTSYGADRDAIWHEAFSPASPPKSAEVLAAHPDAAARTARLVTSPTARRVVAIANAMHNACRPSNFASAGLATSEEAWAILLSRRDMAYMQSGTKWERLVTALDPIPDWAANQLQSMDIVRLGSVGEALIRGPYRRV